MNWPELQETIRKSPESKNWCQNKGTGWKFHGNLQSSNDCQT